MQRLIGKPRIGRRNATRSQRPTFLADRLEQVPAKEVHALGSGDALYRQWLAGLDLEYGRKQAEAIRQVLALLSGAEEAHAWVFNEGRKTQDRPGQ